MPILAGEGSVIAARMAVEDFDAADKGITVEIVSADHQNKPDVASTIARQWYRPGRRRRDRRRADLVGGLAVNDITREKNKVFINSGAALVRSDRRQMLAQHHPLDL